MIVLFHLQELYLDQFVYISAREQGWAGEEVYPKIQK